MFLEMSSGVHRVVTQLSLPCNPVNVDFASNDSIIVELGYNFRGNKSLLTNFTTGT